MRTFLDDQQRRHDAYLTKLRKSHSPMLDHGTESVGVGIGSRRSGGGSASGIGTNHMASTNENSDSDQPTATNPTKRTFSSLPPSNETITQHNGKKTRDNVNLPPNDQIAGGLINQVNDRDEQRLVSLRPEKEEGPILHFWDGPLQTEKDLEKLGVLERIDLKPIHCGLTLEHAHARLGYRAREIISRLTTITQFNNPNLHPDVVLHILYDMDDQNFNTLQPFLSWLIRTDPTIKQVERIVEKIRIDCNTQNNLEGVKYDVLDHYNRYDKLTQDDEKRWFKSILLLSESELVKSSFYRRYEHFKSEERLGNIIEDSPNQLGCKFYAGSYFVCIENLDPCDDLEEYNERNEYWWKVYQEREQYRIENGILD